MRKSHLLVYQLYKMKSIKKTNVTAIFIGNVRLCREYFYFL